MFENDYLMHYGIKGQKWGVRRYQNTDGSLTTAGRARYSKSSGKRARYGLSAAAVGTLAMAPVVGLGGYRVAQHMKANKQSAKNVMYDLERSGTLKGLTADQIKKVEKEVKSSVRRNSIESPVYSTEASAKTAGERVASQYKSSGKRARYGSENTVDSKTAVRVDALNKKIDKYNTRLQKRKAVNDAQSSVSLKRAAAAGLVPTAINAPSATQAALATPGFSSLPLGIKLASAGAGLGLGAAINAGSGALVGAVAKHSGRKRAGEARLEKKLTKLVDKRNALDPSQANRQGSVLTKEQYAKQYNRTKGALTGLTSLGLLGGLAGAGVGSFVKKSRDAEYENYKKNAVAYGSKKKKRR